MNNKQSENAEDTFSADSSEVFAILYKWDTGHVQIIST